jgi:aerobic carbon-monoxide dehydrogenase medium subunit
MRPTAFDYVAPRTLGEALDALRDPEREARPISGGQSLVPLMNLRFTQPDLLVDLRRLHELRGIEVRDDCVALGAMTTHAEVEESEELGSALPILAAAAREIGHSAIRSRGTIGGSVAHADPAAEWPVVFATLDARISVLSSAGTRVVPAREFFLGYFMTALDAGEIVASVEIPRVGVATGWSFREMARQPGAFAIVSVAALVTVDTEGLVERVVVGVGSCSPAPLVFEIGPPQSSGTYANEALGQAADTVVAGLTEAPTDIHATAADRREIARALVEESLAEAANRVARG